MTGRYQQQLGIPVVMYNPGHLSYAIVVFGGRQHAIRCLRAPSVWASEMIDGWGFPISPSARAGGEAAPVLTPQVGHRRRWVRQSGCRAHLPVSGPEARSGARPSVRPWAHRRVAQVVSGAPRRAQAGSNPQVTASSQVGEVTHTGSSPVPGTTAAAAPTRWNDRSALSPSHVSPAPRGRLRCARGSRICQSPISERAGKPARTRPRTVRRAATRPGDGCFRPVRARNALARTVLRTQDRGRSDAGLLP